MSSSKVRRQKLDSGAQLFPENWGARISLWMSTGFLFVKETRKCGPEKITSVNRSPRLVCGACRQLRGRPWPHIWPNNTFHPRENRGSWPLPLVQTWSMDGEVATRSDQGQWSPFFLLFWAWMNEQKAVWGIPLFLNKMLEAHLTPWANWKRQLWCPLSKLNRVSQVETCEIALFVWSLYSIRSINEHKRESKIKVVWKIKAALY